MSLDVYLTLPGTKARREMKRARIFVRQGGQTREVTREEWDEKFPGQEPVTLDDHESSDDEVFSANYTHNCGNMAESAGIYRHVWKPEEIGITKAKQLILALREGIAIMEADPERFKKLNPPNGWGSYETFVPWLKKYLSACEQYPEADVRVSR